MTTVRWVRSELSEVPSAVGANVTTNADWEYARLGVLAGVSTPTVSLADLRKAVYGDSKHAYFATVSGLTPAGNFSLSDHRLAYYRGLAGISTGSVADAVQEGLN